MVEQDKQQLYYVRTTKQRKLPEIEETEKPRIGKLNIDDAPPMKLGTSWVKSADEVIALRTSLGRIAFLLVRLDAGHAFTDDHRAECINGMWIYVGLHVRKWRYYCISWVVCDY